MNNQTVTEKVSYYVIGNDSFMSGWGEAKGKINCLVIPCKNYEQALYAKAWLHAHPEMKYVRICLRKPRAKKHVLLSYAQETALPHIFKDMK